MFLSVIFWKIFEFAKYNAVHIVHVQIQIKFIVKNLHQEKLFYLVPFLYVFPFELLLIKWNTKELKFYFVISRQSQADRKPTNYEPCPFTLDGALGSVKQTVPRLHFSETTMNNHRKSGKPNPEQK